MISQELTLTTSRFDAALDRVTREVEAKSQRMRRSFQGASGGGAGGIMGGLGSGAAGLGKDLIGMAGFGSASAALVTFGATVKGSMSWADDLSDLALKLNESAEVLQRVDFAGSLSGIGVEEIASSFIKLERALGDVGNEKAATALANLGLSAERLAAMSLDEKILALSDAFQKARATGTGVADIQALLGKSSAELIPLLEQGSEAIRNLFEEAPVLAEATVQEMARVNDEFDKLIMKAKSFTAEGVGMVARTGQFFLDAAENMVLGGSVRESLDQATANLINTEIEKIREAAQRDQKRRDQAREVGKAGEAGAEAKQIDAADKAEEEIVKRREEDRKRREDEARERDAQRKDYQTARFETLTPEQQMEVMLDKIERATGKRSADESFIASAADVLAQLGDFQGATNLLGMLSTLRGITSRIGGMDRVQSVEQGSMSRLMDKIFGRENRELEAIAKNTNASNTTLDNIYQNLLQPPPRDTFDDF